MKNAGSPGKEWHTPVLLFHTRLLCWPKAAAEPRYIRYINFYAAKWIKRRVSRRCLELRCPQRPIISFSVVPSTQCGSESLGDIWLPAHNECSTGQTSICHGSRETGGVREIEGAAGHLEIAFISQMLRCRCDSTKLDSNSAVILSPKGSRSYWDALMRARNNWSALTPC